MIRSSHGGRRWIRWRRHTVPLAHIATAHPILSLSRDTDGNVIDTILDAASLVIGVKSFVSNVKQGNVGAAIIDGIGIIADAAAVATPFVPGGVGAGIKAIRAGNKVANVVQSADRASDAVKTTEHAFAGVKSGSKASGLKNAERIKEGRQFEKEAIEATKASGADVVPGVRVVPQNGTGNKVGNRSTVDQLIRNKDNTYQIIETKLTPKSGLSHGQNAVNNQVVHGSGKMEVRSNVPEFNLKPGSIITVEKYNVIYKNP